jgi:hypothetical protein
VFIFGVEAIPDYSLNWIIVFLAYSCFS